MLGVSRYHEVYSKGQGQILGCVLPYEDACCLYNLINFTIFLHYGRNGYICSKFHIIGIMQVRWSTYSYVHMELSFCILKYSLDVLIPGSIFYVCCYTFDLSGASSKTTLKQAIAWWLTIQQIDSYNEERRIPRESMHWVVHLNVDRFFLPGPMKFTSTFLNKLRQGAKIFVCIWCVRPSLME